MATEPREIAIVVRYTDYEDASPDQRVSLMGWFAEPSQADAEAARLNSVRRNEGVTYFVKILRDRRGNLEEALEPPT
jgi:hypothetical protein